MTLPPLASVEDLTIRLGLDYSTMPPQEVARAGAIIEDVSDQARVETGESWYDEENQTATVVPTAVSRVVLAASRRLFENPRGFTGEQMGAYNWRIPTAMVDGEIFTPAEKRTLLAAVGQSRTYDFHVPLATDHGYDETFFVADFGGGDDIPWESE